MEAPEVPTEHLHEEINEHAHESKEKWQSFVALTTAVVAALAAVASLLAGKFETDAMLEQLHANDQWGFYQAKGIKGAELKTEIDLLESDKKTVDPKLAETVERYKNEQKDIQEKAKQFSEESDAHLARHETLASAVTMFQIAIAVAAISILMKRQSLFHISLVFIVAGVAFLVLQLLPAAPHKEAEGSASSAEHTAPATEAPH
jgi:septal ring factor EnvC (AmiA/AmiB activator)